MAVAINGLNQAKEIAKTWGGECLSVEYQNVEKKLLWKCRCGNLWEASLHKIKSGRRCPICSNKKRGIRFTLKEAQDFAVFLEENV
jgi:rubrerythrin